MSSFFELISVETVLILPIIVIINIDSSFEITEKSSLIDFNRINTTTNILNETQSESINNIYSNKLHCNAKSNLYRDSDKSESHKSMQISYPKHGHHMDIRQLPLDETSISFLAAIRWDDKITLCTGTIISQWHVLTAAHCVIVGETGIQRQANRLAVRVGSLYAHTGGILYDISKYFIAPNYVRKTKSNDLAVLQVKSIMEFSQNVELVPLASSIDTNALSQMVWENSTCVRLGWNTCDEKALNKIYYNTPEDTSALSQFHIILVNFLGWNDCVKYSMAMNQLFDTKTEICTKLSSDTCHKGSGGPLICDGKQYGVLTKESGCSKPPGIDILARVDVFYDIITDMMIRKDAEMRRIDEEFEMSGATSTASTLLFLVILTIIY